MPSVKRQHILASPTTAIKILLLSTLRSILATFTVLTNPSYPLALRTALVRAWYGTSFTANSDTSIWYRTPAKIDTQRIDIEDFGAYVILDTKPADIKNADAVYIYTHVGGMLIGHPLQYLNEYKRWVATAGRKGNSSVMLASRYPKSLFLNLSPFYTVFFQQHHAPLCCSYHAALFPQKKWPAQRIAYLGLYS
jgi:hypothetical protein